MRPGLAAATRAIGWVCVLSTENTGSVCNGVKSLTVNSAALFDAVMVAPRPHRRELRDVPAGPAARTSIAIVCREHGGERAGHEKAPANGSGIRNANVF
jgi:hypothetical protein